MKNDQPDDTLREVQARLAARTRPTLRQTEALVQRLLAAEALPARTRPDELREYRVQALVMEDWIYNLREFFEHHAHGWRAVVSSDPDEESWVAYIEQHEVRIYASQLFALLPDALRWCEAEMARHAEASPEAVS